MEYFIFIFYLIFLLILKLGGFFLKKTNIFFIGLLLLSAILFLTSCTTDNDTYGEKEAFGTKHSLESLDTDTCVDCHEPYVTNFKKSEHAVSLTTIVEHKASGKYATNECLTCHSADYMLSDEKKKPTIETASHSMTCVSCHIPHDEHEGIKLRYPKEEVCSTCHTGEPLKVGKIPRQTQNEMYHGTGGVGVEDKPSVMADSGVYCQDCHMPIVAKGKVATGEKKEEQSKHIKNISSHQFNVILEGENNSCTSCHVSMPVDVAEKIVRKTQTQIKERLTQLDELLVQSSELVETYAEQPNYDELKLLFDEASFNVNMVKNDRSYGYHNPDYANALLNVAEEKLNTFLQKSQVME